MSLPPPTEKVARRALFDSMRTQSGSLKFMFQIIINIDETKNGDSGIRSRSQCRRSGTRVLDGSPGWKLIDNICLFVLCSGSGRTGFVLFWVFFVTILQVQIFHTMLLQSSLPFARPYHKFERNFRRRPSPNGTCALAIVFHVAHCTVCQSRKKR